MQQVAKIAERKAADRKAKRDEWCKFVDAHKPAMDAKIISHTWHYRGQYEGEYEWPPDKLWIGDLIAYGFSKWGGCHKEAMVFKRHLPDLPPKRKGGEPISQYEDATRENWDVEVKTALQEYIKREGVWIESELTATGL